VNKLWLKGPDHSWKSGKEVAGSKVADGEWGGG